MLAGYDRQRPKKENYLYFEQKLVKGLSDLSIDGLSLMLYGSYVRGDCDFGRSDIDALLVFPDEVVINKESLHQVSEVLHNALKGNNIPFQATVTDIKTMEDGRFNSYDSSFKDYFEEEARIFGADYRNKFKYELPTMAEQVPVRFNLRKMRNGLLFIEHDLIEDHESFLRNFTKSMDAVSRGSKQILYFVDGKLRKNRFSALEVIPSTFPEVDVEPLRKIRYLYNNLEELDKIYKRPAEVIRLWEDCVSFFEDMLRQYIKKNPR